MKYNVRLKTTSENGVFEMEVEEMVCKTCRYCHYRDVENKYSCWGEKEAPVVSPYGCCEHWRSKNVKTNT